PMIGGDERVPQTPSLEERLFGELRPGELRVLEGKPAQARQRLGLGEPLEPDAEAAARSRPPSLERERAVHVPHQNRADEEAKDLVPARVGESDDALESPDLFAGALPSRVARNDARRGASNGSRSMAANMPRQRVTADSFAETASSIGAKRPPVTMPRVMAATQIPVIAPPERPSELPVVRRATTSVGCTHASA